MLQTNRIYAMNALEGLKKLDSASIDCVVTSPPYWAKRDYGVPPTKWPDGKPCALGLEKRFEDYLAHLLAIFDEVQRVLKPTGTVWVNLGDTFVGSWGNCAPQGIKGVQHPKSKRGKRQTRASVPGTSSLPGSSQARTAQRKSLALIPQRFAIAMAEAGWICRGVVIWHKPNSMPESVKDRFTSKFEYLFLFVKSPRYFFDLDAIRVPHKKLPARITSKVSPRKPRHVQGARLPPHPGEPGSLHPIGGNPGDVWLITTKPGRIGHLAPYPEKLCERPILAGCPASVCMKCGTPQLIRRSGGSANAFNIHVRDVKRGRGKHADHSGSPAEVSAYDEQKHKPKLKVTRVMGCRCKAGFVPGVVLDPFMGVGTTAVVAKRLGRQLIGFELNQDYARAARQRVREVVVEGGHAAA